MSTFCQKELERLLECPICVKQYRDPRLLSCGHHFCLKCLTPLDSTSITQKVKCPTCRVETPLSEGCTAKDLPQPYTLNALQRIVKQTPKQGSPQRSCDLCPDDVRTKASFYCHQCRECLCDQCHVHHNQASALTNHVIDVIGHVRFCDIHSDQIVTKYCLDCKAAVCKRCLIRSHRDHLSDELQSVATRSRERLQSLKEKIEATKADLLGQILLSSDVQKQALRLGKCCEGVLAIYRTIRENLQRLLNQVDDDIRELNGIFSGHKTEVIKYQANLKTKLTDMTDSLSDIEKAMTSSSEYNIIADEAQLSAIFDDGMDRAQPLTSPRLEIPDVFPKYGTLLTRISASLVTFQRSFSFVQEKPSEKGRSQPVKRGVVRGKAVTAPNDQRVYYLLMNLPELMKMQKLRILVESIIGGDAVKMLDFYPKMSMARVQVGGQAEIRSEDLANRGVCCTINKLDQYKFEENCIILNGNGTVSIGRARDELERASGVKMVAVCKLDQSVFFIRYNGAPDITSMKKCKFNMQSGQVRYSNEQGNMIGSSHTSISNNSDQSVIIERVPELVLCHVRATNQDCQSYFDEVFLKCYLEAPDKSDGGKIGRIYKHVPVRNGHLFTQETSFFVWFTEAEVAERVCKKRHTVDSQSLSIQRFIAGYGVLNENNNNVIHNRP